MTLIMARQIAEKAVLYREQAGNATWLIILILGILILAICLKIFRRER